MKKAIVLLSGGLDSTTVLYHVKHKGFVPLALIFDYGQRHRREIGQAKRVARHAGCPVKTVNFTLPWKGSVLLEKKAALPSRRTINPREIPATYVPGRNIIFLSFALSFAEAAGARDIFIGANAVDYSGYPDCRPEFFQAFREAARRGLKTGVRGKPVRIHAPLIKLTKAGIVRKGLKLGVPWHLTWSCYRGGRSPCGQCDSCRLRQKGFGEAGVRDPLVKGR